MRLNPKLLLIVVAIIALVVTAGTLIGYYRASLLHFNGKIDKDYLSAFGSFISGTVGIIFSSASFILIYYTYQSQQNQLTETKRSVNRQLALSVRPDLVVSDLYTTDKVNEDFQSGQMFDGFLPVHLQFLQIEILNVGIEVARYIEYKFEYSPLDLISYLNNHSQTSEIELEYTSGLNFGNVKRVATREEILINMVSPTELKRKGYLMPFKLEKDKILIPLPYFYIVSYYYTVIAMYKSMESPRKDLTLSNFPKCLLKISYLDLEAKKYDKTFDIKVNLLSFSLDPKSNQTQFIITADEMYQNPF